MTDTNVETPEVVAETPAAVVKEAPVAQDAQQANSGQPAAADLAKPKEAEPPKKDPEAPKAKYVAKLMKQESELRRQQAAFADQQKQFERQVQGVYAQLQEMQTKLQQAEEEAVRDPISWLQNKHRIGPEEYYQRAMNGGQPSKEEVLHRELGMTKKQLEELVSWRKEQEAERAAWQKQQEEERAAAAKKREADEQASAYRAAQDEFWGEIEKNPDTYPDLHIYPKEVILQQAAVLVEQLGEEAEHLSYIDVAKRMQDGTAEWHQTIEGKRSARKAAATPSAEASAEAPVAEDTKAPAKVSKVSVEPNAKVTKSKRAVGKARQGDLTLHSDLSSSRGTAKTGVDWDQAKEEFKRELEAEEKRRSQAVSQS